MSTAAKPNLRVSLEMPELWMIADLEGPPSDKPPSNHNSAGPRKDDMEDDDEDGTLSVK